MSKERGRARPTDLRLNDSGEAGFTVTELLAAIGVISAAGLIAVWLFSSSAGVLENARNALSRTAALLGADRVIREKIAGVAIPYWERRPPIIQTGSSLEVAWYGGAADGRLTLRPGEAGLVIEASSPGGLEELNIGGLRITALGILRGENGLPAGLDLTGEYGGRAYHAACLFGTFPAGCFPVKGDGP